VKSKAVKSKAVITDSDAEGPQRLPAADAQMGPPETRPATPPPPAKHHCMTPSGLWHS
jgi:hypothetical protein